MKEKGISKGIISIIYCVIVFIAALIILSAVMNHGNTDMTAEMGDATFPVLTFRYGSYDLDCIRGYVRRMDDAYMRDSLTPMMNGRKVSFRIDTYGGVVSEIHYELRTASGDRLIEDGEIFDYVQNENMIFADLSLKDLMDPEQEYSLCIVLTTPNHPEIRYYTRIFDGANVDPNSMLYFVYNFSNKTFRKAEAQNELTTYLESNKQGDNTTFHRVDIHSSFNQITWGNLDITKVTTPQATILDINDQVAMIELNYLVKVREEEKEHYYRIKEYFRIRQGSERMYLLDYERTMNQIFDHETGTIANNKFVLGITDEQVNMMENADGNRIAFVSEGHLYSYNILDNKLADIFSFYTKDMSDLRTTYDHNDIRIFNIDETGNVKFLVYGYMNRGEHEGEMGLSFNFYDSVLNTVEEKLFVPYDKSFELLKNNISQLAYVNSTDKCYLYLEGDIYEFDLANNKYKLMIENIYEDRFVSSKDHHIVAYVEDVNEAKQIEMLNMLNDRKVIISTGVDEFIHPIGFFGSDLVYGLTRKQDVTVDSYGNTVYPMYKIVICSEDNRVIKEYQEEGFYIIQTDMSDTMVTLTRVTMDENGVLQPAVADQILNNQSVNASRNKVETAVTDTYETIVQIAVRNEINTAQMQILNPRFVLHEGGSMADLDFEHLPNAINAQENDELPSHLYYTYIRGNLVNTSEVAASAVRIAYENNGIVLDNRGQLIFHKVILPAKNQIMAIAGSLAEEENINSQRAVCLNTILTYNGISEDTLLLVRQGKSSEEILAEYMPEMEILNMYGCPLETALTFVAKDIPVLVEFADGSAMVLVGYNEYNTVVMDPVRGEVYKIGINDSTKLFEENGNRFITYIR